MNLDLKNQAEEYIKCKKDPIYFLKTYGTVRHPVQGLIPFALWDFQEDTLRSFLSYSYNVILKARQLGISTLCAGYVAWLMNFFKDKEVYILCTKQDTAINLVDKVKVFFENMPDWMSTKILSDNKQSITLANRSKIKASGTSQDAIRSEALSLLIVDEAAFIRGMDGIWVSGQPTLSTGGDCIALSTPNGIGNWFHKQYADAVAGEKIIIGGKKIGFNPIKLHWSMHPDRDQDWADAERKKIGTRAFAQEHDADFLQSGNNVVDYNDLIWYTVNPDKRRSYITAPLEKIGFDSGLWVWKYPEEQRKYLVSADVARGDGSDYSAFQVLDIESYEQVAEYRGKVPTDIFGHMLVQTSLQYNSALLVIENNGPGWATIQKVIDLNYMNIYYSDKSRAYVDTNSNEVFDPWDTSKTNKVPGFTTSSKTRPVIIARMEEDVRNHEIILRSERLMTEYQTFVYTEGGKPIHLDGYNDDLIFSLSIGMFVRGTNFRMYSSGSSIQKTLLENLSTTNTQYKIGVIKSKDDKELPDSYKMAVGSYQEDLRWLL